MKKIVILIVGGVIFVLFVTFAIRSCTKKFVVNENINSDETNEIYAIESDAISETHNRKGVMVSGVENDIAYLLDGTFNWDELPLSKKFLSKYHSKYDLIRDIDDAEKIMGGTTSDYGIDSNICQINIFWNVAKKSFNGNKYKTIYYVKYSINENNELDDIVIVKTKDVNPTTGERLDGKIEAALDNVSELLHYIANPYHDFDFVYTHNYSEEAMPYSDICKIVNRPDLDKLGVPDNSYDEKKGNDVYIVFEYPDWKVTWKVNYKVNDDLFFDYIEYIEVDE